MMLNLLEDSQERNNLHRIIPIPDIIHLLNLILNTLNLLIDEFEINRKKNKAHLLIRYLRGYR